jgi:hypothetical protein
MLGPFAGYRSTAVAMFRIVYRSVPRTAVEVTYVRHCRDPGLRDALVASP